MHHKKILIAGGTGFIGQALAARFGKDNRIIILSRHATTPATQKFHAPHPAATPPAHLTDNNNRPHTRLLTPADGYNITYWRWDGRHPEPHWAEELNGCDLVLNLAGKSVNCRYNAKNKQEIFDSRTDATHALGEAIRQASTPPKLWINAASATIYRHAEDRPQDETTGQLGRGFSVRVCQKWERCFYEERTPFTRKIALRLAITLGEQGVMIPYCHLLKAGLAGRQGNGRQMYSWIHIDDLARAIEWMIDHPGMEGTYNISSPHPVPNHAFMQALRKAAGQRFGLPAPAWLLKIGAALIGTETELLLKSRWVLPTNLLATGFQFRYPRLEDALTEIFTRIPRKRCHLFGPWPPHHPSVPAGSQTAPPSPHNPSIPSGTQTGSA